MMYVCVIGKECVLVGWCDADIGSMSVTGDENVTEVDSKVSMECDFANKRMSSHVQVVNSSK